MNDYSAHPLFLNENSDDPPEVGFIHIIRYDGPFGSARKVQIPKQFAAEEIQSTEQIYDMYGGGNYELVARNFDNTKITDKRRITLPGKPKPIVFSEAEETEDEDEPRQQTNALTPPAFAADSIMGMFMHSMTMQMQMMQSANEASRSAAAEQTKMMLAMMSQNQNNQPRSDMTEILKIFAPILSTVVGALLQNKTPTSNPLDQVLKTMEVVAGIKDGVADAKSGAGDDWQSLIKQFMAGMAGGPPAGIPPGMHPAFQHAPPVQQAMPRRRIVEVARPNGPPPEQRQRRQRPMPEPEPEPAGPPPNNSENNTQ